MTSDALWRYVEALLRSGRRGPSGPGRRTPRCCARPSPCGRPGRGATYRARSSSVRCMPDLPERWPRGSRALVPWRSGGRAVPAGVSCRVERLWPRRLLVWWWGDRSTVVPRARRGRSFGVGDAPAESRGVADGRRRRRSPQRCGARLRDRGRVRLRFAYGARLRAVSGVCTHQGCALVLDRAARQLDYHCPCHNSAFAVTGEVLHHQLPIHLAALPRIAVREADGQVQVYVPPPSGVTPPPIQG